MTLTQEGGGGEREEVSNQKRGEKKCMERC